MVAIGGKSGMNLYQAGYTRRGGQGEGAGWSIVAPSEEMSRIAMEGFRGISGNLVELVNHYSMPKSAVGLFFHDRFFFYLHINYAVSKTEATDARGVSFVHGYSFSIEDNYRLAQNPERLLGITDQMFQKSYDTSIKAYPVLQELPYKTMDDIQLRKKYRLYIEEYHRLLIGATCALEGYTDSLCIKVSCPLEEYQQICLEVMYLILSGLPYHLRTQITFFSYKGGKTKVYFSDQAEGNNVFDLDTMISSCYIGGLEHYQFLQLYTLENDKQRQFMLQEIADFINQAFALPRKEIGCEQVEHGYQAKQNEITGKIIDSNRIMDLLYSLTRIPCKQCEAITEYLIKLLESANQSHQLTADTKLLEWLMDFVQNSSNPVLQEAWLTFYARQFLATEEQEGYKILLNLYQKDKQQHQALTKKLWKISQTYYTTYYEKVLLPKLLDSLTGIADYLKENPDSFERDKIFDRLLQKTTEQEISATKNFTGLWEARKKTDHIVKQIEQVNIEYAQKYRLFVDYMFWKRFDLAWFSLEEIENYKSCSLNKLASSKSQETSCETARIIKQLIKVYESICSGDITGVANSFFFTKDRVEDDIIKKVMQDTLRKDGLKRIHLNSKKWFDLSLLCYYNQKKKEFDAIEWAKKVEELEHNEIFQSEHIKEFIANSSILKDRERKRSFIVGIAEAVEHKTRRNQQDISPYIKRGLKQYYRYLTSGNSNGKQEAKAQENFLFSLHKIAVGYLPFFSLLFFLFCLKQYSEIPEEAVLGIGFVFAAGFIAVGIGKVIKSGGIKRYLNKIGVTILPRLVALLLLGGLLLASTGIAGLFWIKFLAWQQEPFYRKTVMGVVVMGIYILVAMGSAVWESSGKDRKS